MRPACRLLRAASAEPDSGQAAADSLLAAGSPLELKQAWRGAGSAIAQDELVAPLDALSQGSIARMIPVCDLAAFFAGLRRRGLTLRIASSDSEAAVIATARHFGIAGHVAFRCDYDSGHGVKPGPGMVLAFCRETGLEPSEIAVIGDNGHDMEMGGAAGAGLRIAVLTGTGTRETLVPLSDHCIASIAVIEDVLP